MSPPFESPVRSITKELKERYLAGELILITDLDPTGSKVVGLFRVQRNFQLTKVLEKWHDAKPGLKDTLQELIEYLLTYNIITVEPCTEIFLDCTSHLVDDTVEHA